jgi:DNA-binding MarR family transcriptional regulator
VSHEAVTLVKSRAFGSVSTKAVALVLADYCDAEWSCYVGQERLAWEAEVGTRTARRILQQLERSGLIARRPRYRAGHRTSDLIVLLPKAIEALPARLAAMGFIPATDDLIPANERVHTGQSLAGEPLVEEPSEKNRGDRCEACGGDLFTFDDAGTAIPCLLCHPLRARRKSRSA